MFLDLIQDIIEQCSSLKQCLWFHKQSQNTMKKKIQARKLFREIPTALIKTRLLKSSQKQILC